MQVPFGLEEQDITHAGTQLPEHGADGTGVAFHAIFRVTAASTLIPMRVEPQGKQRAEQEECSRRDQEHVGPHQMGLRSKTRIDTASAKAEMTST